jgi:hypothetical protein
MASFWNANTAAVEVLDDVADIKEDNTNVTSKLLETDHKKQRCVCAKVIGVI